MDNMQDYELYIIYDDIQYVDYTMREMARMICYVTAQVQSSKKLTPQELWKLPWDIDLKSKEKAMSKKELQQQTKFEDVLNKIKTGQLETKSVT